MGSWFPAEDYVFRIQGGRLFYCRLQIQFAYPHILAIGKLLGSNRVNRAATVGEVVDR